MKKITLLFTFLFSCFFINAQDISYGAIIGANAYDINITNDLSAHVGNSPFNFGGFIDFQIDDSFGIKTNIIYSKITELRYTSSSGGLTTDLFDSKLSTFQIHPHIKYDVNKEYNKGFYLIVGPRITFILNAEDENSNEIIGLYKKSNFGAQLGFGFSFLKHYGLEIIGDYGISDFIDSNLSKGQTIGGYLNLTLNLDSLIKK